MSSLPRTRTASCALVSAAEHEGKNRAVNRTRLRPRTLCTHSLNSSCRAQVHTLKRAASKRANDAATAPADKKQQ